MKKYARQSKALKSQIRSDAEDLLREGKLTKSEIARALTERYSCEIKKQNIDAWNHALQTPPEPRTEQAKLPSKKESKNASKNDQTSKKDTVPNFDDTDPDELNEEQLKKEIWRTIKKNYPRAISAVWLLSYVSSRTITTMMTLFPLRSSFTTSLPRSITPHQLPPTILRLHNPRYTPPTDAEETTHSLPGALPSPDASSALWSHL